MVARVMIPRRGEHDGKFQRWTSVVEFPHDTGGQLADAMHALRMVSKELHIPIAPMLMGVAAAMSKEEVQHGNEDDERS